MKMLNQIIKSWKLKKLKNFLGKWKGGWINRSKILFNGLLGTVQKVFWCFRIFQWESPTSLS
jgi:hypothetical protein